MSDYRDSKPIVILPPAKELKGDGECLYPDKWPQFAPKPAKPITYEDFEQAFEAYRNARGDIGPEPED